MAETTADVRRDIELTRERMSTTLAQLEQKLNVMQVVKDNPWPALLAAVGAGVLLSGSRADIKAAAATVTATRGASSRIGVVLDDLVANLVRGVHGAIEERVDGWVSELKHAVGIPSTAQMNSYGSSFGRSAPADSPRAGTSDRSPSFGIGQQSGATHSESNQGWTPRAD
ncbi:MAG: hypothetical protein NVS1B4_14120 [Gemmatimonadaceae bacterium]